MEPFGAAEPVTLTDPDGAVTRVAPWSAWTREQVRRPGGESALVTRLDEGRLWFSSGRQRSPWQHEVHVGPAIVSTPGGRFQATIEVDGGSTVACLAGRTRVVAGLERPLILHADQSAAISSDGQTLVVLDRPRADSLDVEDPLAGIAREPEMRPQHEAASAAVADVSGGKPSDPEGGESNGGDDAGRRRRSPDGGAAGRRWAWLPELAAAAAVLAVLIAAVLVLGNRHSESADRVAGPASTTSAPQRPGSRAPSASTGRNAPETTAGSTAPASTEPPTTSPPATAPPAATVPAEVPQAPTVPPQQSAGFRPAASGASASGRLQGCRRAPDGVHVQVDVRHRGGPASRFQVRVAVGPNGSDVAVAEAVGQTDTLAPASTAAAEVTVPVPAEAAGWCEFLDVTPI